jgi:hypothetical protein
MAGWITQLSGTLALAGSAFAQLDAASAVREFNQHIAGYMKMRTAILAGFPALKPSPSPEAIAARSKDLAAQLRARRGGAQPGVIFTPEVRAEFQRLIAITMQGKSGPQIRESMQNAEPVSLALKVNDAYPTNVPLQSTPPTLLENLPQLPKQLEYRIVGRALVLRDQEANLVIDFIPQAITI